MSIVVGYTERPESAAAVEWAANEAKRRGAVLHIVQTLQKAPSENPTQTGGWAKMVAKLWESGAAIEAKLHQRGIEAHYQLLHNYPDSPGQQLLSFAGDVGADLIVIGLRRRSPVGKLVLGSVAQEVLLGADCPVLAIKAVHE